MVTVGQYWGSSCDGTEWTYDPQAPITRMEFCSGFDEVIYSIKFIGHKNGWAGPDQPSYGQSFDIKPSEYLTGMNGGYKHFSGSKDGDFTAIQWLSFKTNMGEVPGTFGYDKSKKKVGEVHGTSGCSEHEPGYDNFQYEAPQGYRIVGFYGRASDKINGIGVLIDHLPRPQCEVIEQLGPWGTPGGKRWIYNPDSPITKIVVVHVDEVIISILFKTEKDVRGQLFGHENYPHGRKTETIELNSPITGMSGTYTKNGLINSLSFQTSDETPHGQIGAADKGTDRFSTKNVNDGYIAITGFHGCYDPSAHIISIGVHVKRICNHSNLNTYIFVKQWGGPGGKKWEFHPGNGVINQIIICHGEFIFSLGLKTDDGNLSDKFGGNGGKEEIVEIPQGVHLEGISGTFGTLKKFTVLTSLKFYTSDGNEHGPFGKPVGTEFSLSIDGSIVGFHGHAGGLVDAIGVYLKPKPLN